MLLRFPLLGLLLAQQSYAQNHCTTLRNGAGIYNEEGTQVIQLFNAGHTLRAMCYKGEETKVKRNGNKRTGWVKYSDRVGEHPWWDADSKVWMNVNLDMFVTWLGEAREDLVHARIPDMQTHIDRGQSNAEDGYIYIANHTR